MNCPHCESSLSNAAQSCGSCGFTLSLLKPILGDQWVRLDRITDAVHALRLSDTRDLEVLLDDFERRFPQAFAAIYLGQLPRQLRANALGFWLLNHGAFNTPQVAKRNDFGVIVVIDYTSTECAISLGYALEHLIPTATLQRTADLLAGKLRRCQLGLGLGEAISQLSQVLRGAGRPETRKPIHHQSGTIHGMGLRSLRSEHRPIESEPNTVTAQLHD